MSTPTTSTTSTTSTTGSTGSTSTSGGGALSPSATPGGEGGQGRTTIADAVVSKIAGLAAREVPGVYGFGGTAARAFGAITERIPGGRASTTQGVSVEVGEREAAVDLTIVVEYGESIPKVAQQIRENVIRRIEGTTGLAVTEVNVTVNDLHFPGDEEPDEAARVQ